MSAFHFAGTKLLQAAVVIDAGRFVNDGEALYFGVQTGIFDGEDCFIFRDSGGCRKANVRWLLRPERL